jgi:hypothetical protein
LGEAEGTRQLRRYRRQYDDNIKVGLREIGLDDLEWIHLTQDKDQWSALANTVMNFRVHKIWGIP